MNRTNPLLLGVNIDHVATLREARGTRYPDPVYAAQKSEEAGADGITLHLREDRRHIQDRDLRLLKDVCQTRINLEMAVTEDMLSIAETNKPEHCCLVPEKREELTTEGGLDVIKNSSSIKAACQRLREKDIDVSLFIDADLNQIDAAMDCGASTIEIHTGHWAHANNRQRKTELFNRIAQAATYAKSRGLVVNAGHGLHYHNVGRISAIPELNELNIGHAIIAHAVYVGIDAAVREMKQLMLNARLGVMMP